MAGLYDTLKTALDAQLVTLYPVGDFPVENAMYAAQIAELTAAMEAQANLSARPHASYSTVGVSFSFRDPAGAAKTASNLRVQLARAGFSLNAGTPIVPDLRDVHDNGVAQ